MIYCKFESQHEMCSNWLQKYKWEKVKLNRFPKRKPDFLKRWIDNCKLYGKFNLDWQPGPNSALCEYHFTNEMWEIDVSKQEKKLKKDAVPTVFGDVVPQVKVSVEFGDAEIIIAVRTENTKDVSCSTPKDNSVMNDNLSTIFEEEDNSNPEIQSEENSLCNLEKEYKGTNDLLGKNKKLETMYQTSEHIRSIMKTNFKKTKRKLTNKIKKVRILESKPNPIFKILNKDQYHLLSGDYKKIPRWCDETLVKAYQLKFACGINGYKELINQNIPLPSLRVLQKQLEN